MWQFFAAALILGVIAASIATYVNDYEGKQKAFMSKCIEFHAEGTCFTYFKYNREDLATKPPGWAKK